jgi:hypothetical protein
LRASCTWSSGATDCDGELGVRHHDRLDPGADRALHEREDLVARQVPRAEDHLMPGDDFEDRVGLGEQRPLLVDDGHRLAGEAGLAQGELEAHPDRHLALRVGGEDLVLLVDRRHRREPHDPRPFARRDLDRQRVEAADAAVERDGTEHRDPRDGLGHHLGALGGRGVVRLQPEAGLPCLQAAPRELDVGDPPRDEVRCDVHVVVDAAADELSRALAGDRMLGLGGHRPSVVHSADCRQSH